MHLQGWENVCAELTTSLAPQQQIHSKLKAHWAFHSNLITSLVTPLEELGGWGASCKGQVPNESAAPQVLLKKLGKGIFFFCADVQHIQEKAMWKDVLQPSQMIQSHYSLSPLWGYPAGHPHYSELGKQHESQSSMVGNQKAMLEHALANVMNLGLNCKQVMGPVCLPSNTATFMPLSPFHTWILPSSEPIIINWESGVNEASSVTALLLA